MDNQNLKRPKIPVNDLVLTNAGEGRIDVGGSAAMAMLDNPHFVFALLHSGENGLCYDRETHQCVGYRIRLDEYQQLVDLLPRHIAAHMKDALVQVVERPVGEGIRIFRPPGHKHEA